VQTSKEVNNEIFNGKTKEPLIFLSHKSDDKKYGDALAELIRGLGIKKEQLVYTSHQLYKCPQDENIYEYLKKCLYQNVLMIFLWSDTYLESPACLNEMGAAWITKSDYTNMFIPSFTFNNPKFRECAVDTNRIGAVLNGDEQCKANITEFKNKILRIFNLCIDEPEWLFLLDRFIEQITSPEIKPLWVKKFIDVNNSFCAVINRGFQAIKDDYITIFKTEQEIEHYVATCEVENIQENGLIIAKLVHFSESDDTDMRTAKDEYYKKLIVKRGIYKPYKDSFKR